MHQLNGFDLGGGYRMTVARADFSYKQKQQEQPSQGSSSSLYVGQLLLPRECEADKFAVLLLKNCFDPQSSASRDATFIADLELDLLSECNKHGTTKTAVAIGMSSSNNKYYIHSTSLKVMIFFTRSASQRHIHRSGSDNLHRHRRCWSRIFINEWSLV